MEYTTLPSVGARLSDRWQSEDEPTPADLTSAQSDVAATVPA
jgi:hypothetical protein